MPYTHIGQKDVTMTVQLVHDIKWLNEGGMPDMLTTYINIYLYIHSVRATLLRMLASPSLTEIILRKMSCGTLLLESGLTGEDVLWHHVPWVRPDWGRCPVAPAPWVSPDWGRCPVAPCSLSQAQQRKMSCGTLLLEFSLIRVDVFLVNIVARFLETICNTYIRCYKLMLNFNIYKNCNNINPNTLRMQGFEYFC